MENKVAILEAWLATGIPVMQGEAGPILDELGRPKLEFFPRTVRQFNAWDGSQNSQSALRPFGVFKVNANATLRKHPHLLERVVSAINSLRVQQDSASKHVQRDAQTLLKERLKHEALMRTQLEDALRHLKRENKRLTRENLGLKTQRDNIMEESHRAINRLKLELARIEQERKVQG
ncbi:hypothetical protein [Burkholderia seminalis]|uniref:hypothetical protein n=1 Tax=Burkholderia seminalis TaxID=488731 RepID=UPI001CF16921|nr:hypothetical protein [Burkholderia seminalis]MCA8041836.1 hypothetical protein [Burkholderia seminalis]